MFPWDWGYIISISYGAGTRAALLIFSGLLPTAAPFFPRDASTRFQSRSGYLTRKHPNKQPVFPRTLFSVVYGVISSSTRAINFLTICHRFYELVPLSARSAQASPRGAPNWGQWLCRAMTVTYPSMDGTQHLTSTWRLRTTPLFIQSVAIFFPNKTVSWLLTECKKAQSFGATGWKPTAPITPLGKYWLGSPQRFSAHTRLQGVGDGLAAQCNWDLPLDNKRGDGWNIKRHPWHAQWGNKSKVK